jgi:stress response protein YsnF
VSVSNNKENINWNNVLKKEVIGTDGLDLGEVAEVGDNFIIIQKGLLNKKRYIIPISTVENFDGDILRVKVNENDLLEYEEPSDPQFKDYSTFKSSDMSREIETKIPVIGENLEVAKKIVEDKVDIIKDPIKETKTVEIELTYEKVSIERIPFENKGEDSNDSNDKSGVEYKPAIEKPVSSKTQISIPLKREVPVVIKNPYIREEVVIKKKPVKETKIITTDITHERVSYGENDSQTINEKSQNTKTD